MHITRYPLSNLNSVFRNTFVVVKHKENGSFIPILKNVTPLFSLKRSATGTEKVVQ